jgi:hypothetical protein
MTPFVDVLVAVLLKLLESTPALLVDKLLDRIGGRKPKPAQESDVALYPPGCGDRGIDLGQQRLLISSAFGTYFAGLLERDHSYIGLKGQIQCPARPRQECLAPLQRIYWAMQYARGPQALVIAGEGGMGKSTLAAKIVRCLFSQQAVDMILGDSAKTQRVDPTSGTLTDLTPSYYDVASFYKALCGQLGLPYQPGDTGAQQTLSSIRDRLEGRRAVIVVDNLETVSGDEELLRSLHSMCTRDVRVIVTTRRTATLTDRRSSVLVVTLRPLKEFEDAYRFLRWHIRTHSNEHPRLKELEQDVEKKRRVDRLIERTGGIPLLMQLVLSDVARSSWGYIEDLPRLFGEELLSFLYASRWDELRALGKDGSVAQNLLRWAAHEQYRGREVTFNRLTEWALDSEGVQSPQPALRLLQERFLIVNYNPKRGNFALFPSLVEFLDEQPE